MNGTMELQTLVKKENNDRIKNEMEKNGIASGTSLEITLTQDAACYEGYDSTGSDSYSKYSNVHNESRKRPEYKVTGFVHELENNKLVLCNVFPIPLGTARSTSISYDVIDSYKINK